MIALDNRLKAAKNLVRAGSTVADIGTDHAYLICALVREKICPGGFACDINEGPLLRAQKTIETHGLQQQIKTVLTNGLQDLPYTQIEDIVIAGMGGDLISEIILAQSWTRDARLHFVLQPMTKAEHLRKNLCENGFAITGEVAAQVGRRVYTVLEVQYTGQPKTPEALYCYTGELLHKMDSAALLYLEKTVRQLEKKALGLQNSDTDEAARLIDLARQIRRA